jgi:valyl-tRNA synthetase
LYSVGIGDLGPMVEKKLKSLIESKKRIRDALRIEKEMLISFRSPIPAERLYMERKMLDYSEGDPELVIMVLLANYNHKDIKVVNSVRSTLDEMTKRKEAMVSILDLIMHPDRDIRRNAFKFFNEKKNFHYVTYISFLEQTLILLALARKKGIPILDIVALVEVSKDAFLEGRTMAAVKDIAASLDLIKYRLRSVENLKNYIVDVLRLAPELTRMGVYPGSIEEPLKRVIKASKTRSFNDTRDIILERMRESTVRKELERIGKIVNRRAEIRPVLPLSEIEGTDVWLITAVQELMEMVTSSTISGNQGEAIEILRDFLGDDFREFYREEMVSRVEEGDASAIFGLYTVGIVCLKLSSAIIPEPSEMIYQKHFRRYEEDPSIHVVMWPEIVMKMATAE